MEEKEIKKKLRRVAMNMLARREHSQKELQQKLLCRFPDNRDLYSGIIQQLADDGLQSDFRFAENYCRWRAEKGFGSERIRLELNQKGVEDFVINQAFDTVDIDWFLLLQKQFEKKYHSIFPEDLQQKAKYMRFFIHRGFPSNSINKLLSHKC